jgi:hypothetical protein
MNNDLKNRRKAARRTAIGLVFFALAIFTAFYVLNIK